MEFTLKYYAVATGLVAAAFWVWAIVNSVNTSISVGFVLDFGTVTFLLVMIANALLYRHVTKTETPIPKNISTFVTVANSILVLNYFGGFLIGLGTIEPICSGDLAPRFETACTLSYAIYCVIAAAVTLVWTIFGWYLLKANSGTKDLDVDHGEDEDVANGV